MKCQINFLPPAETIAETVRDRERQRLIMEEIQRREDIQRREEDIRNEMAEVRAQSEKERERLVGLLEGVREHLEYAEGRVGILEGELREFKLGGGVGPEQSNVSSTGFEVGNWNDNNKSKQEEEIDQAAIASLHHSFLVLRRECRRVLSEPVGAMPNAPFGREVTG